MAQYTLSNTMGGTLQAIAGTAKTLSAVISGTAARARVWDVEVGADGTYNATDCSIRFDIARKDATTAGTSTSVAAASLPPVNPADPVAVLAGAVNYTAEPTTYTSLLPLPLNQRASQRWNATSADQCLVSAATLNFTIGVRALSGTFTGNCIATIIFDQG
jgi:hypothetical protein